MNRYLLAILFIAFLSFICRGRQGENRTYTTSAAERFSKKDDVLQSVRKSDQKTTEEALIEKHEILRKSRKEKDKEAEQKVLSELGTLYFEAQQYKQALDYYEKSFLLAEKAHDKEAMIVLSDQMGRSWYQLADCEQALMFYQIALQISSEANIQLHQFQLLNGAGISLLCLNRLEPARYYFSEALRVGKQSNDRESIASSCNNIGLTFLYMGAYDSCIAHFSKAMELYKSLNDDKNRAATLLNHSIACKKQGYYQLALESAYEAAAFMEKQGEKTKLHFCYNTIATILEKNSHHEAALEYHSKALKMAEEIEDRLAITTSLNNIGLVYKSMGAYDKALEYYTQSLEIKKTLGDLRRIAATQINRGEVQELQGDYRHAERSYLSALALKKQVRDTRGHALASNSLASLYLKQGELARAKQYLDTAARLGKKMRARDIILENYRICRNLYRTQHQFEKALNYYDEHIMLKDSLFNEQKSKALAEMQIKYETEKKEKENIVLKKDQALKEAEIKQKRSQRNILLLAVGMLIIFITVIVIQYRNKIKIRELIVAKNHQLQEQRIRELKEREKVKSARDLLDGQEIERKRIARELHDGIGGALASIKLNLELEASKDTRDEKLIKDLAGIYGEVRSISHNLMPPSLDERSFIESVKTYTHSWQERTHTIVHFYAFPEGELNKLGQAAQAGIYRILQELLNNIAKHAEASEVHVQMVKNDRQLNVMVEDDGVGFDPHKKEKGIGLKNIRSRVDLLGGVLHIDSAKNRGTVVNMTFENIFSPGFDIKTDAYETENKSATG